MAATVDQWRPSLVDPIIPARGSSLAADDRAYPDYAASQVAWTGIRSAIDATAMFFTSLAADQTPHETGHRALTRAGLTDAALAVFVLAGDRPTRIRPALRAAHDDLGAMERAIRDLHAARWSDPSSEQEGDDERWQATFQHIDKRRDRLRAAADAAGLSYAALKRPPTFREMVDYAAGQVPDDRGDDLLYALRMSLVQLNAASHSLRWHAILTATHAVDTPEGTRARLVTTATDLFLAAGGAMTLAPRALELFRARAKPP